MADSETITVRLRMTQTVADLRSRATMTAAVGPISAETFGYGGLDRHDCTCTSLLISAQRTQAAARPTGALLLQGTDERTVWLRRMSLGTRAPFGRTDADRLPAIAA